MALLPAAVSMHLFFQHLEATSHISVSKSECDSVPLFENKILYFNGKCVCSIFQQEVEMYPILR